MQKILHISTYANKFMHNFGKNVKIFLIKHCEKLLFAAFFAKHRIQGADSL